jgi:hypothetical protein
MTQLSGTARAAIWLVAATGASLLLAWFSPRWQAYFAPVLLLPLLEGAALGAALGFLALSLRIPFRKVCLAIGAAAALAMICGQHWFAYRMSQQALQNVSPPPGATPLAHLALAGIGLGPDSLAEYLDREAQRGRKIGGWMLRGAQLRWLWALEALLAAGACVAMQQYWTGKAGGAAQ